MKKSEKGQDVGEEISCIVRIAYQQLNIMTGFKNPIEPEVSDKKQLPATGSLVCVARLMSLPMFTSAALSFRDVYATVKGSHEMITSVFDTAEDGFSQGVSYVSPLTDRVAGAAEVPLKTVDNAVCVGLDFLEENVPSVKLPPGQIYNNISSYVRDVFTQSIEACGFLFASVKTYFDFDRLAIGYKDPADTDQKIQTNGKIVN